MLFLIMFVVIYVAILVLGKKNNIRMKKYVLRTRKWLMVLIDFTDFFHDWEFCLLLIKEDDINEKSLRNLKQYTI